MLWLPALCLRCVSLLFFFFFFSKCSCWQSLFYRDNILYHLVHVSGYEDLMDQAKSLLFGNEDIRSVVMINCGAIVDVESFLHLQEQADRSAYVIDYHRPVHMNNINNSSNVVVFADTDSVPEPRGVLPPPTIKEPVMGDDDDKISASPSPSKRARTASEEDEVVQEEQDDVVPTPDFSDDFASGSYYGTSASMLMYELAAQEAAESSHAMWLACLGLTEHFLQHRCSAKQYVKHLDVLRLAAVTSNDKALRFEQYEYQFVLHRHWTLYDSMHHSPQIATRLHIWTEQGRRRLDQLLAKMGFPLFQCRQKFSSMNADIKDRLPSALDTYAPEYGLKDLTFPSFIRTLDNKVQVSASDFVYVVSTLLEQGWKNRDSGSDKQRFWQAYDALSARVNWNLITEGLNMAIGIQKSVIQSGVDVLMKRIIVRNGPFRFGFLNDSAQYEVFSQPHLLTRLALFLLDALRKPGKPSKPLVLGAFKRDSNSYLMLGVTPAVPSTRAKRNDFGVSFLQAARLTGAQLQFLAFDSSIIEVAAQDATRFIELLHSGLLDQ